MTGKQGIGRFRRGQLEHLPRAGRVADEHGDDWAERRAKIAG